MPPPKNSSSQRLVEDPFVATIRRVLDDMTGKIKGADVLRALNIPNWPTIPGT
jgi:hypothetical protein